ncbi:hypothetical protein SprV_0702301400 [Sparganum proliferum]
MTELLKSKAGAAHIAFEAANKALADGTMLHHIRSDAHPRPILTVDASNTVVGAVLYPQKIQPAQARYGAFSREFLATYMATRHFRSLSKGRDFRVHTDHKPLTCAFKTKPDRYLHREVRYLDYISQFTEYIPYVRGSDNVEADAQSRPDIHTLTSDFDLEKPENFQSADKSVIDLHTSITL